LGKISMKDLLETGVHFGHQVKRSNPKMKPYIFTKRKGINIIDLQKTVELSEKAYEFVKDVASRGETILFVGTKKQARPSIEEAAQRCNMPYVSYRWLGGLLTNFVTIRRSIDRLKHFESILENSKKSGLIKKEVLLLERKRNKLNEIYKGVRDMTKLPDAIFIVDTSKEETAVKEAVILGIPIVGVVDTNGDPTVIDYPIPGNDDAIRAIAIFTNFIADAVIEGRKNIELEQEGKESEGKEIISEKDNVEKETTAEVDGEIKEEDTEILSEEKKEEEEFVKTEESGEILEKEEKSDDESDNKGNLLEDAVEN